MKWIKRKINNFKYNYSFLLVLFSPFRSLKLKFYYGEIQHGTPYFLPRKWIKCDKNDAIKAWNKLNKSIQNTHLKSKGYDNWILNYTKSYTKPIPIKYFGYNFVTLGWKTKWDDYRFEWSPMISVVLFGKQICVWVVPNISLADSRIAIDCYWEAWLNYKYKTDKTKSRIDRINQLKKIYSCTWGNDKNGYTDYYEIILKDKYTYEL